LLGFQTHHVIRVARSLGVGGAVVSLRRRHRWSHPCLLPMVLRGPGEVRITQIRMQSHGGGSRPAAPQAEYRWLSDSEHAAVMVGTVVDTAAIAVAMAPAAPAVATHGLVTRQGTATAAATGVAAIASTIGEGIAGAETNGLVTALATSAKGSAATTGTIAAAGEAAAGAAIVTTGSASEATESTEATESSAQGGCISWSRAIIPANACLAA